MQADDEGYVGYLCNEDFTLINEEDLFKYLFMQMICRAE
jgi:hypothetical protein